MFEQVEQVLKVLKMLTFLGAELLSNWLLNEVSPPDETALVRQFRFLALRRLRTSQLRPTMTGPTKTKDRRGMKLQQLTSIHRRDREFSLSPEGARAPREQVNFYEQVEQVLTDALRCSDVENMDLEQVSPRSTLARLAAGQTLYRLLNNRLGTLWLRNPGSEGIEEHSNECLMPQDMPKSEGFIGRYGV